MTPAEIFAHLTAAPEGMTYKQLAHLAGVQSGRADNVLLRLEDEGLLTWEQDEYRRNYRGEMRIHTVVYACHKRWGYVE